MNPEELVRGAMADVVGQPGFDPGPVQRVSPDMTSDSIQQILLSALPPLIDKLVRASAEDRAAMVRSWTGVGSATSIGTFGDQFLYGGRKQGSVLVDMVRGLAVLSTAPGGVSAFGLFFCASHCPQGRRIDSYWVCEEC